VVLPCRQNSAVYLTLFWLRSADLSMIFCKIGKNNTNENVDEEQTRNGVTQKMNSENTSIVAA
jgi:hypothetical protein